MRVGMITSSASREAGGIYTALLPLSRSLRLAGAGVEVFAGRDGHSDADLPGWGGVPVHLHRVVGPARLGYQPGLLASLEEAGPDIAHLHGLWRHTSWASLRWSRGGGVTVVSPHGMLDAWALGNSRLAKRVAAALYESANLARAACIHALCDAEMRSIRALGFRGPVAVIPNGVDPAPADRPHPAPDWASRLPAGARRLLFLGRIHPKKGIASALDALAMGSGERRLDRWHLIVAGWDQGGHEGQLRRRSAELGLSERVHFVGPQTGDDKAATLAAADAFILPSRSEGLPMAVLEAWSSGLPVLMTAECNLPEGFEAGAALRIGRDAASILDGLRTLAALSGAERAGLGNAGRRLVRERFAWAEASARMLSLYGWLLGEGSRPDFVHLPPEP